MLNEKINIIKVWAFWVDGIKYHDHYLSENMSLDGIQTYFICPDYTPPEFLGYSNNKKVFRNNYKILFVKYSLIFGKPFVYDIINIVKYIRKIQPKVIHIYGISNLITLTTLLAAKIALFKGLIIFNDHSDPNEKKKEFIAKMYYKLFFIIYCSTLSETKYLIDLLLFILFLISVDDI